VTAFIRFLLLWLRSTLGPLDYPGRTPRNRGTGNGRSRQRWMDTGTYMAEIHPSLGNRRSEDPTYAPGI